jgi:hypothetical protein
MAILKGWERKRKIEWDKDGRDRERTHMEKEKTD